MPFYSGSEIQKRVSSIDKGKIQTGTGYDSKKEKRKLSSIEKKQIKVLIRNSKGDGKVYNKQQYIPYLTMYPDSICEGIEKNYSKSIAFEDINDQLAGSDDKTTIFESWCDFLNYFDAFNSILNEYTDMLKNQLTNEERQ